MFDNLRDQSPPSSGGSSGPFFEEPADEIPDFLKEDAPPPVSQPRRKSSRSSSSEPRFLGMTGQQRFIIIAMLVVMTCLFGIAFLLISGAIYVGI
jgi:hypothetical protein